MKGYSRKKYKVGDKVKLGISYNCDPLVAEHVRKVPGQIVTIKEIFTVNSSDLVGEGGGDVRFYIEELGWHFPVESIIEDFIDPIDSRFEILDL